jgi:cobalt-zinc-cadmium efflux system membrane fusion protein
MLDIIDPSQVFIEGYVPPGLAKDVRPGQIAGVAPNDEADVDRSGIRAVVQHILPSLDVEQRAARVLFSADAPGGWPKSGQQVRLSLAVPTSRAYIRLPLEAVEFEGENAFVFIQLSPDRYEKRSVDLAEVGDADVLVASGLAEGEMVVTTQVFSLKALSKFEEYAE